MNGNTFKIIGLIATGVNLVTGLVSNWVGEKQLDDKIAKKVAEAVAKAGKES